MGTSLWLGRRGRPNEPWESPTREQLPDASHDVVIAGAGITGLATAVHLAQEGLRPLVLEARWVGAGTTGHTTAKLSLLQGAVLSGIREHFNDAVTNAYVEGDREGQQWLLAFLGEAGVPVQRRDAYTYAVTDEGAAAVAKEWEASRAAGLAAERVSTTELPFPTSAAIRLADQAQFDPTDVLAALRAELEELGGSVVEGVRVTDVSWRRPPVVTTTGGRIAAKHVVLATGTPILDRGLYFAKLRASRSFALAFRLPDKGASLPRGMYLSLDKSGPARFGPRRMRTNSCCSSVATGTLSDGIHPPNVSWASWPPGPRQPSLAPNGSINGRLRTTSQPTRCPSSDRCLARAAPSSWRPATTSGAWPTGSPPR